MLVGWVAVLDECVAWHLKNMREREREKEEKDDCNDEKYKV